MNKKIQIGKFDRLYNLTYYGRRLRIGIGLIFLIVLKKVQKSIAYFNSKDQIRKNRLYQS